MTDWLDVEEVRAACERERERLKAYGTVPKHYETMRRVLEAIAALPEPPEHKSETHWDWCGCALRRIWLVAREVVGG